MIGDITDPFTLAQALSLFRLDGGDVLLLRGGTYSGDFTTGKQGYSDAPVIIMPYPGESVVIDGSLIDNGTNIWWCGIEFMYSGWTSRLFNPYPPSPNTLKNVSSYSPGSKYLRCHFHDLHQVGIWTQAVDFEMSDCLVYNIGVDEVGGRGHGHMMYTQNNTGTKRFNGNIFHTGFAWNFHAYSGEAAYCNNYLLENNTFYNPGALTNETLAGQCNILFGSDWAPMTGLQIINNMTRKAPSTANWSLNGGDGADGAILIGNHATEARSMAANWTNVTESGNTWATVGDQVFVYPSQWSEKSYLGINVPCPVDGSHLPTRGTVTIYNEANADTVTADLSPITGLAEGNTVNLINSADPDDIQVFANLPANKQISINMQAVNRTIALPVGTDYATPASTFPQFGAFVLEAA